jgi:ABC-type branched-subunit amino acid transport system substrate-binding protein
MKPSGLVPHTVVVLVCAALMSACTNSGDAIAGDVAPKASVDPLSVELENPITVASTSTAPPTVLITEPATAETLPPTLPATQPATLPPTLPPTLSPAVVVAEPITVPPTAPPATRVVIVERTVLVPAPTPAPAPRSTKAPAPNPPPTAADPTAPRPSTTKRAPRTTRSKRRAKASSTLPATPPPVAGFDGKTITLTNLGTKTNPSFGPIGRSIQGGLEAHFAAINAKGGIGGRYPVVIRYVETDYDPAVSVTKYEQTKGSSVGFASILGTPNVAAILPLLERDGLTASPASSEAEWPLHEALLPFGSTYQQHAINGADYFWAQTGLQTTMCALSIAGPYGDSGVEGVTYAGRQLGGKVGPMVRIDPTTINMIPAIQQLAAAGCRGVMVTTAPQQALAAAITGERAGYKPRWIWMAPTWTDQVLTPQTGKLLEETVWIMNEGPGYRRDPGPDTPGLYQLVREAYATGNRWVIEQMNIGAIVGWVQARAWATILERAVANRDLSPAGIRQAASQIGPVDFGGLVGPMDYARTPRVSSGRSSVFAADASWLLGLRFVNYVTSPAAVTFRKGS